MSDYDEAHAEVDFFVNKQLQHTRVSCSNHIVVSTWIGSPVTYVSYFVGLLAFFRFVI